MTKRTLIEIDHNLWRGIDGDPIGASEMLIDFMLGRLDQAGMDCLRTRFGITILGTRDSSEPWSVVWGETRKDG